VWAYAHVHDGARAFWVGSEWRPEIVRVPRARNPNLHAQGGVFTVVVNPSLRPGDRSRIPSLDHLILDRATAMGAGPRSVPLLYQLRLDSDRAGELLRLLRYEHISSTYLFPGYDGVIRGITERRLWDEVTFPWDF
jgi:hypothetical protein